MNNVKTPVSVAVIPASGIGDALIFHTLTHFLQKRGNQAITFSPHLEKFGSWFSEKSFQPFAMSALASFDMIFLQHDNSERAKNILEMFREKTIYRFYGSYKREKHGPIEPNISYISDQSLPMLDNLSRAAQQFFGAVPDGENGLLPPAGLIYRKYPKRIVLHPTSSSLEKNWPRKKYVKLALHLKRKGLDPIFTVSSEEKTSWPEALSFSSLEEFTSFLYESGAFIGNDSGPGHLASYLKLPHLILGPSEKQLRFWKPSWYPGRLLFAPAWSTSWKWSRKKWPLFLPTKKVLKNFLDLLHSHL